MTINGQISIDKNQYNELCGFGRMYIDILSMTRNTNSSPVKARKRAVFIMKNLSDFHQSIKIEAMYK